MQSDSSSKYILELIAASADLCLKPWLHSVVTSEFCEMDREGQDGFEFPPSNFPLDLTLRIECRDKEGRRHPQHDLELEIYRSGKEVSLMLSWHDQPELPILWHGQHSLWMEGNSGQRCSTPVDGCSLESLARRIRAIFD